MAFYFALFNVSNSNRELRDQLHQLHHARRTSKEQRNKLSADSAIRGNGEEQRERRRHSVASMSARRRSSDLNYTPNSRSAKVGLGQPLRIEITAAGNSPSTSSTLLEDSPIVRLDRHTAYRRLSSPEVSPRLPANSFSPRFHYYSDNDNPTGQSTPSAGRKSGLLDTSQSCCLTPPLLNYKLSPTLGDKKRHSTSTLEDLGEGKKDSIGSDPTRLMGTAKRVTFMSTSATASNLLDMYGKNEAERERRLTGCMKQAVWRKRPIAERRLSFDLLDLGDLTGWSTKAVVIPPPIPSAKSKSSSSNHHSKQSKGHNNNSGNYVEVVSSPPRTETLRSSELGAKSRGRSGQAEYIREWNFGS